MPATTPTLALPYPVPDDTVDVPRDVKALADKLDAMSSLRPALVSALPGSPVDAQEVYFAADATNGLIWHLRYRAAAAGSYKWEFLGGPPLFAQVNVGPPGTYEATNTAGYGELATSGPTLTLPLAGDYMVGIGARTSTVSGFALMSYSVGGGSPSDDDALWGGENTGMLVSAYTERRKNGLGTTTLSARYRTYATPNLAYFGARLIRALPVRVG